VKFCGWAVWFVDIVTRGVPIHRLASAQLTWHPGIFGGCSDLL
jgi:hypothetical protein